MKVVKVSSTCKCFDFSTSSFNTWLKQQIDVTPKYTDLKAEYWQHHARVGASSLVHDIGD